MKELERVKSRINKVNKMCMISFAELERMREQGREMFLTVDGIKRKLINIGAKKTLKQSFFVDNEFVCYTDDDVDFRVALKEDLDLIEKDVLDVKIARVNLARTKMLKSYLTAWDLFSTLSNSQIFTKYVELGSTELFSEKEKKNLEDAIKDTAETIETDVRYRDKSDRELGRVEERLTSAKVMIEKRMRNSATENCLIEVTKEESLRLKLRNRVSTSYLKVTLPRGESTVTAVISLDDSSYCTPRNFRVVPVKICGFDGEVSSHFKLELDPNGPLILSFKIDRMWSRSMYTKEDMEELNKEWTKKNWELTLRLFADNCGTSGR